VTRLAVGLILVVGPPLILGMVVIADAHARHLQWKTDGPRHATWYWRIWWWYGYHGLYRVDWWLKRRAKR
jgi:hypothetical protein